VASFAIFAIAREEFSESTLALAASAALPNNPEVSKGADRSAAAMSGLMSPITESRRARIILEYSLAFDADRCPKVEARNTRTVAASDGEESRNSND
jgi:hypothetical protein